MSRPLRIEFSGALYHVTSRGDRRESIFDDDVDRELFLSTLAEVVARFNWVCHAYCLTRITTTWWWKHRRPTCQRVCANSTASLRKRRTGGIGAPAPALATIAGQHEDRDSAIAAAYATGAYSYREIAEHFRLHLATVGRIVRRRMLQSET